MQFFNVNPEICCLSTFFLWSWWSSLSEKSILCKFYDANIWNISICRNVVFFQIFWLVCSGWVNTTLLTNWKCDISQLEIWLKHQLVSLKLGQGQILHQLKYEVFEVYVASKGWYIYSDSLSLPALKRWLYDFSWGIVNTQSPALMLIDNSKLPLKFHLCHK